MSVKSRSTAPSRVILLRTILQNPRIILFEGSNKIAGATWDQSYSEKGSRELA